MDVGKENLLILEIIQCPQPSLGRNTLEEPRRCLVGGDARRGEKPDHAVRFYDGHSTLDKERIEVYVAAGQQGIISASSCHAGCGHRTFAGRCEVMCKRIASFSQDRRSCACGRLRVGPGRSRAAAMRTTRPVAASSGPRVDYLSRHRTRHGSCCFHHSDHTPGKATCQLKKRSSLRISRAWSSNLANRSPPSTPVKTPILPEAMSMGSPKMLVK